MSPKLKGGHLACTTLAAVDSLTMPPEQELVFLADFRCSGCQQKVTEIMSKMNEEIQSVVVSVLEKKITVIHTYPATAVKLAVQHATASTNTGSSSKASSIARRIFRSFYSRKRALT